MKSLLFAALTLACLVPFALARDIVVLGPEAIAAMTDDDLVAARQAAMKEDGMMLRGAGKATGEEAIEIATTVLENFTNFPALFREGSITEKSYARPIIWEQWDQFEALLQRGQAAAGDMQAAAEAEDGETYAEAIQTLGGLCRQCHETYREPLDD
jgi:cytochrome c556